MQRLVARRLGRLFLPLAALLVFGAGWAAGVGPSRRAVPLLVAVVAPVAAASAMAYGLRTVRRALGAPHRPWTGPVSAGGVPVWIYGLAVLGAGLRDLPRLGGAATRLEGAAAAVLVVLGGLVLRAWWRLDEVRSMVGVLGVLPGDEA